MPTKVSVGLSKKQGRPDYGSIGASCHVELELDGQILDGDLARFRQHVRRAYVACRETIEDELTRDLSTNAAPNRLNGNGHSATSGNGNGFDRYRVNGHESNNGNGRSSNGRSPRQATSSQVKAIHAIAGKRIDVSRLVKDRFNVQHPDDLSISDASTLIDELKAAQSEASR